MLVASPLIYFDRIPSEHLGGVLHQLPISLGGNIILIDAMVIGRPLEFNMILRCDYICAMKDVVSSLPSHK